MATTEGASFTSRLAEEAIAPGICVTPGDTNPTTTVRLPDAADDINGALHFPIGVSVLDAYRDSANYADGDNVRICVKGDIFVYVTEAVKANGPVFVTATTGAFSGTTGVQLYNAAFLDASSGAEVVRVRLNGPFTTVVTSA